jgi:hypothetical protein
MAVSIEKLYDNCHRMPQQIEPQRQSPYKVPPSEGPGMDLKSNIRSISGFPKPGILFYDISTLLAHAEAW